MRPNGKSHVPALAAKEDRDRPEAVLVEYTSRWSQEQPYPCLGEKRLKSWRPTALLVGVTGHKIEPALVYMEAADLMQTHYYRRYTARDMHRLAYGRFTSQ